MATDDRELCVLWPWTHCEEDCPPCPDRRRKERIWASIENDLRKDYSMNPVIDLIREWLREHPNVSNALAGLIVVIIAAIAADLGVGEPGAEAVRVIAP